MDEFDRCSVCARTPLVGEQISVLCHGGSESLVCDLCLAKPRAAALGEEVRRDRVRTAAGADTVRIATAVAVRKPPSDASEGARRRTPPRRAVGDDGQEAAPGITRPASQPAATG